MDNYFSNIAEKLQTKSYSNITVVLGNESCDLDSAISSLVYAVFLHWQYGKIRCGVCTRTADDVKHEIFVPVLDVDRQDIELKTEVAYCLREAGVRTEDLVFRDDINLKELVEAGNTKIVLLDHHNLCTKFEYLAPHVVEIIDHRPLDRSNWTYRDDTRTTIEVVGSCCTLVARRIKELSVLLAKDESFFNDYPICADLLHSCILVDTVNFSKEVNKATPMDEEMVNFLEGILGPKGFVLDRQSKTDRLLAVRSDVSSLSAAQLLRKDAKVVGDVLVPALPILVEEFLSKPNAMAAVVEALGLRHCSVALLLGMKLTPELRRDMAVFAPRDSALADSLVQGLQQWSRPHLQLQPGLSDSACLHYRQMNLAASRKQYIPAVSQFLGQR